MLRLFKVEENGTPVYFNDKRKAKIERDRLIAEGKSAVVMRGPDHRKGESYNENEQSKKVQYH